MPHQQTRVTGINVHLEADATDLRVADLLSGSHPFVALALGQVGLIVHDLATVDRLQALLDEARALLTAAEQKAGRVMTHLPTWRDDGDHGWTPGPVRRLVTRLGNRLLAAIALDGLTPPSGESAQPRPNGRDR